MVSLFLAGLLQRQLFIRDLPVISSLCKCFLVLLFFLSFEGFGFAGSRDCIVDAVRKGFLIRLRMLPKQ